MPGAVVYDTLHNTLDSHPALSRVWTFLSKNAGCVCIAAVFLLLGLWQLGPESRRTSTGVPLHFYQGAELPRQSLEEQSTGAVLRSPQAEAPPQTLEEQLTGGVLQSQQLAELPQRSLEDESPAPAAPLRAYQPAEPPEEGVEEQSAAVPERLQQPSEPQEQSLEEQCRRYNAELPAVLSDDRALAEESCSQWCESQAIKGNSDCKTHCLQRDEDERAVRLQKIMPRQADSSNMVFVVWFAVGEKGAMGFENHQYHEPDMRFASALQKSHPGRRIVIMTDQDTQLRVDDDIEIFRFNIDKSVFGRNAYANYFQFQAQVAFLESLEARGAGLNVVFMDMDILIVDSIVEVFCQDYDYGVTITNEGWNPINLGIQYVKASKYTSAITFLQMTLDLYKAGYMRDLNSFTVGQSAIAEACNLINSPDEQNWPHVMEVSRAAARDSVACRQVKGEFRVCFFTCLRYNFIEECMENENLIHSDDPASVTRAGVKTMHFVAFRKPGLDIVWDSYVGPGGSLAAARRAFAGLPKTEDGYRELVAGEEAIKAEGGATGEEARKAEEAMEAEEAIKAEAEDGDGNAEVVAEGAAGDARAVERSSEVEATMAGGAEDYGVSDAGVAQSAAGAAGVAGNAAAVDRSAAGGAEVADDGVSSAGVVADDAAGVNARAADVG